jgi:hypothetical protein
VTFRLDELRARAGKLLPMKPPTLEQLVTSPDYFGLETATAAQRGICRIADGIPLGELAAEPDVIAMLGGSEAVAALPVERPRRISLLSAPRGAKSMIAAASAIRQSQIVDLSGLRPGEQPRVSIVSVRLDQADVVRQHLLGAVLERPKLRALLVEEPSPKGDHVILRHPSGIPIEVKVVAGSGAGSTLVSRWCAGAVFDEAPRMVGASEGVVNLDHMHTAIADRMRAGATVWDIGSPWAPFGPVYRDVTEHFGKPTRDLVVIRATGPMLNPLWWTEERLDELRRSNPVAYRIALAEFADPEESLLPSATLDACTRASGVEERRDGHEYAAAIDPATRGNAWTLAIATRRAGRRVVVLVRQWVGSSVEPLDPDAVLHDLAAECHRYGVENVETDQWSGDALRALAKRHDLNLVPWPWTQAENTDAFLDFAARAARKEIELPPDPVVRADLLRVRKRVTQSGLAIVLPQTSDGRHCDYAPAIVRATRRHCREWHAKVPETSEARVRREQAEIDAAVAERWAPKSPQPSWRKGY